MMLVYIPGQNLNAQRQIIRQTLHCVKLTLAVALKTEKVEEEQHKKVFVFT